MKPPIGTPVVDTRTGKVGIVMGHEGPYVQLRPYGGGREWDADPAALREATGAERVPPSVPADSGRTRE
jgi:hypothetical protein